MGMAKPRYDCRVQVIAAGVPGGSCFAFSSTIPSHDAQARGASFSVNGRGAQPSIRRYSSPDARNDDEHQEGT